MNLQAAILSGHVDLSEFIMAASVVVSAVASRYGVVGKFALLPIGVALMALAFLVV
jgi:hypothetical protein